MWWTGGSRPLVVIDVTQSGWQNAAPQKASMGTGPIEIGAFEATKAATRAARSRTVPTSPGATPKSASEDRVQRFSDAQRVADAEPIALAVLVRSRTNTAVARSYAQSASAPAIAESEYRWPRPMPRGTTTRIAPHALHQYRRAKTPVSAGAPPGASGPSIVRSRKPCPTIIRARPGSRLAASHATQHEGRAASHEGHFAAQDLTSMPDCTIRCVLRGSVSKVTAEHGGERRTNAAPATSSCRPRAGAPPPAASYDTTRRPREKPDGAMALSPGTTPVPSRSAREIDARFLSQAAR